MSLVTRSATIQVRVVPIIKKASEQVLWRIGLNMSEAVELFLRRVIVDERIPFEVVAIATSRMQSEAETGAMTVSTTDSRGHRPKKEIKKFFRGRTSSGIRAHQRAKKGRN